MVTRRRTYTQEQRSALLRALHRHHESVEYEKAKLRQLGVKRFRTFTRVCPDMHVHVDLQFMPPISMVDVDIRLQPFSLN